MGGLEGPPISPRGGLPWRSIVAVYRGRLPFSLQAGGSCEEAADVCVEIGEHSALDADGDVLHGLGAADAMDDERTRELLGALVDGGKPAHRKDLPPVVHGGIL